MDTQGTLGIKATLDISELQRNVHKYVQNIDMMQDHTDIASQSVARSFSRMQAAGMAFLSIDMAKRLASEMVSVYGTFQQLEIKFTSMLQSGEKAQKLMGELINFAAITPFDLKGVSQSATQLVAYGTAADDVIDRLTRLGNIAAGLSQPIGDIVYLYGTSMTQGKLMTQDLNQFAGRGVPIFKELAKVMGVNKDEIRDLAEQGKISFSYLEQVVDNLTNKGGMFFNLMQEQSKSVTGRISNLGDSIDMMFNEIGKSSDGFINGAIDGASYLVEHYEEVGTVLGSLVALYGIHKAALIAHAAYYNSIKKIDEVARLTAEANALKVLETGEIKASLSKQKLVVGSTAYSRALKAEIEAKLSSQRATLQLATAEHSSAKTAYKAALQRSLASKDAVWRRETDLVLAKAEGDQAKITLAQTELQKAIDERSAATKAKKAAAIELVQKASAKDAATTAVNTTTTALNTAGEKANIAVKSLGTKVTNMLTVATTRLNAALVANKWAIIAIAVAAVCYGIYKLITYQTDAEKAQEKLNKRVKEFNSETEAEQAEIDRLFGKLDAAKKGTKEYDDAKKSILDKYGEYLKGLGDEIEKLNDIAAAYEAVSAAAKQAALDRAIADSTSTAQKDWADKQVELMDDLEKAIRDSTKFQEMKGKKGIDREVSSIIQMIKGDLKSYGKLSAETQKIVDGLTMQYYVLSEHGPGQNKIANDVQFKVNALIKNSETLQNTMKGIHEKLGYDTNQYIELTAQQISSNIANFEAALDRVNKTGRNQMSQLHDGSMTNSMGEAEIRNHIRKLKEVQEQQRKAAEKEAKGAETVAQRKVRWAKELTEAEENLKKLKDDNSTATEKEIETQQKLVDDLKKKLSVDDNSVKSKQKKQEEANRLKVEQAERQRQIDEMTQQDKERAIQTELELAQAKIDTMDEGFKKQQEQIDLNYRKAKADNARRAAQYVKDQQDAERKEWEKVHPKYKEDGLVFTSLTKTKNDLPQDKKDTLDAYDKAATEARKKAEASLSKALLEQYQVYTDKRLALEKKFNDDISVLQSQREQAQKDGNLALFEQINRAIAQAMKDKGQGLMKLDFEQLKQTPDYVRAFENLKNTSTQTLNSLLSQLEKAKQGAAEVLNPEDLREYTTAIQNIIDELTQRNPFEAVVRNQDKLVAAKKELIKAEEQFKATQEKGYTILTDYDAKTGKMTYTYLSAAKALENYNRANDDVVQADNELLEAEKAVSDQISELSSALKNVGDAIGGTSGEIISCMGDITSFASVSMEGLSKLSGVAAKEMSALEKASVILNIISAGIQLLHQLNSLLGDSHTQYEKYAEKIDEINKLTTAVNDYKIALLEARQEEEKWFSEDNLGSLRDFRKVHDEVYKSYHDKLNEKQAIYQDEEKGGWLKAIWKPITTLVDKTYGKIYGFNINKEYEEGTTRAVDNLRIETRKKSNGFLGTGIGGKSQKTENLVEWAKKNGFGELFDNEGLINKEAGKAILDKYGDKLVGQTKETLEALVEMKDKYDEYLDQLHEYVSSLYESLVDNFVDSLWDWLDSGKDALDSFKNYASDTFRDIVSDMMRTIVLDKVIGTFSDDIAGLYEEYAKGSIDETELMKKVAERTEGLVGNYESNIPTLQNLLEQVNGYLKDAEIDLKQSESSSQSSTSKGYATASQDSIDELSGRTAATYIVCEKLLEQAKAQTAVQTVASVNLESLKLLATQTHFTMTEIRDISLIASDHLEKIERNTKELYSMNERLESIEKNTRGLNTR